MGEAPLGSQALWSPAVLAVIVFVAEIRTTTPNVVME